MENIFTQLDSIAGIETEKSLALWLERTAFVFLVLMTLSAPHSIAATQTAWLLGMIFWIARFFIKPRPKFIKTALFYPFLLFFLWSTVTCIFSYAPDISVDRLRNVSLFLIFFFAINNLRRVKAVKFLAFALIFSCMVNVIWTPVMRLIGRGVEIQNVRVDSPLTKADILEGDTLLRADGKKIRKPEDVISEFEQKDVVEVEIYRPDFNQVFKVKKGDLLAGETALDKLGVGSWKRSRNWRSAGFYGHYATYAEVLQLIGSLTLGLFIAGIGRRRGDKETGRQGDRETQRPEDAEISDSGFQISEKGRKPKTIDQKSKNKAKENKSPRRRVSLSPFLLFVCVSLMALALLLTVTRASQLAFMVSAFLIVWLGASRKMFVILLGIIIPVTIGGLIFLQQARNVKFFDPNDNSTTWRQTVYREGFDLWTQNPRHFLIGVGMDSIKRYKEEWGLFDKGKLPPGHFHSTPLQLVVERGLPALLLWLWILGVYLSKMLKFLRRNEFDDWIEKGIVLGCLGGAVGFFVSGLVHYNLGDGEVAMVFYLLMALAIGIVRSGVVAVADADAGLK